MRYPQFDRVPLHYRGSIIQQVKAFRREHGRKDLAPTLLEVGDLQVVIPRHFGFCFGVERAVHMAFSAVEAAAGRSTFLVSEIIHNPLVNQELRRRGMRFLYDSQGRPVPCDRGIQAGDAVLIPAFGTTLEIEALLQRKGVDTRAEEFRRRYDTTCPFVAKVWRRAAELGRAGYTIIIHGKFQHEETRATQSHTQKFAPTLVVFDVAEAHTVADFIRQEVSLEDFTDRFAGRWSAGFDPERDLGRVAVVNQTTMLAAETREVSAVLRRAMRDRYGDGELEFRCADTNDTLCYATTQNQNATRATLSAGARLAVIVGGYNSSNTAHLVEICSRAMPSYLVEHRDELLSGESIRHFDLARGEVVVTRGWLPRQRPLRVVVTSGASCPDVLMDQVIERLVELLGYGTPDLLNSAGRLRLLRAEA